MVRQQKRHDSVSTHMAINEIRWQELFVQKVHEFEKVLPIYNWCRENYEEMPVSAYTWYRIVFGECEQAGGWTDKWQDTGFSLVHLHTDIINHLKSEPAAYPHLLMRFPLYVVFYNRESLMEYCLTWQ